MADDSHRSFATLELSSTASRKVDPTGGPMARPTGRSIAHRDSGEAKHAMAATRWRAPTLDAVHESLSVDHFPTLFWPVIYLA